LSKYLCYTTLDASFSYTKGNYSNPGYGFPFTNDYTTHLTGPQLFSYADPATLIALAGPDNPNNTYLTELDRVNNFLNDNSYDIKKSTIISHLKYPMIVLEKYLWEVSTINRVSMCCRKTIIEMKTD
jgi:hypothetical protein